MRIQDRVAPCRRPLVIIEKVRGAQYLVAISPEARRAGLSVGMTLADAMAYRPDLWVEEMDRRANATLLDRIAEDCDRFSPVVVIDGADGLILDITGCDHVFGGEAELRTALLHRLRRAGFYVRAVIASAPFAARALARFGRCSIVPRGQEQNAVRELPVAALELNEEDLLAVSRAGLKTIAALADRPSMIFTARFGEEMTLHLRRILGLEDTPLSPRRVMPALWVEKGFPEPVARMEDINPALFRLSHEVCTLLSERRQGGRRFELSFYRSDGKIRRVAIETGRPMREPGMLLRLFRERLDAVADPVDPGFGFDLIRLAVCRVDRLDAIQSGLDGRAIETDEISGLIDRLSARFGENRVLQFVSENTHDPGRAARTVPAIGNSVISSLWPRSDTPDFPLRPLLIFNPPQPIRILMAEVPDGPPLKFTWRRREYSVVCAEGPERIAPEWWRVSSDDPTRDYYRLEDCEGHRFWLFRAGFYGSETQSLGWFIHGVFA